MTWLQLWRRIVYGKPCTHPRLEQHKWVDSSGTCMAESYCPDCQLHDKGHVYADPATWETT